MNLVSPLLKGSTDYIALDSTKMNEFKLNFGTTEWAGTRDTGYTGVYSVATPIDAITSCMAIPTTVTQGSSYNVKIMGSVMTTGTHLVGNEYKSGTMLEGTLTSLANGFTWTNTYLDFAPYTNLSVFLPYVSFIDLDIDYFASNHTAILKILYDIDVITGDIVYSVYYGGALRSTHSGNCAINIPISVADWSRYQNAKTSASVQNASSVVSAIASTIGGAASGGMIGGGVGAAVGGVVGLGAGIVNTVIQTNDRTAQAQAQKSADYKSTGTLSNNSGYFIDEKYAKIRISRQDYKTSYTDNAHTVGFPVQATYSQLQGYFSEGDFVKGVGSHLSINGATTQELEIIQQQLAGGVII